MNFRTNARSYRLIPPSGLVEALPAQERVGERDTLGRRHVADQCGFKM